MMLPNLSSHQIQSKSINNSSGFTLIELIIVIVITGILATMTTDIITLPVKSYIDLERRTALTNNADIALRRMQRDIRQALPNSIRITGGGKVLEILHTSDGGRYRKYQPWTGSGDELKIAVSDTSLDIIGSLQSVPEGKIVINNQGVIGENNAYSYSAALRKGDNIAKITSSTINSINFTSIAFPLGSPYQHFFIVDAPVTYRCDLLNGQLLRYEGYAITATQANPPAGTGHIQVNKLTDCLFTYLDGVSSRLDLVSLRLTLTDSDESVSLLHQVHVDNAS